MAIKFQYNKTFLQQLNKELKVRLNALPTLQAKEAALRLEVKKAKKEVDEAQKALDETWRRCEPSFRLWSEFPEDILSIDDVSVDVKAIAGVKTPVLSNVSFSVKQFSFFSSPAWVPTGMQMLKDVVSLTIRRELAKKKVAILEYARKKTTQKVNLYEKVQIPQYNQAILKIKRYLEDYENLAKSSQKILKNRLAQSEAA